MPDLARSAGDMLEEPEGNTSRAKHRQNVAVLQLEATAAGMHAAARRGLRSPKVGRRHGTGSGARKHISV